jgi:uncharacterized protein (UPF0147 family)
MDIEKRSQIGPLLARLEEINKDISIPRNVRRKAQETKEVLIDERRPLDVRSAMAVSILDAMVNDPNIPLHGRPQLYWIMSQLETLR